MNAKLTEVLTYFNPLSSRRKAKLNHVYMQNTKYTAKEEKNNFHNKKPLNGFKLWNSRSVVTHPCCGFSYFNNNLKLLIIFLYKKFSSPDFFSITIHSFYLQSCVASEQKYLNGKKYFSFLSALCTNFYSRCAHKIFKSILLSRCQYHLQSCSTRSLSLHSNFMMRNIGFSYCCLLYIPLCVCACVFIFTSQFSYK